MTYEQAMRSLESAGTEQNRKVHARHGAREPMFGVSFAHLGKMHKQIKRDHDLALKLWASRNHDARVLATMIVDPQKLDAKSLDRWAADLDNYVIADAFSKLAAQAPAGQRRAQQWKDSSREFTAQAGWNIVAQLASSSLSESDCVKTLKEIEQKIPAAMNRVKHAMNQALICIGARGGELRDRAVAAAKRIGKVEVDHGETGCVTPDAVAYIEKMLARKQPAGAAARSSRKPAAHQKARPQAPA